MTTQTSSDVTAAPVAPGVPGEKSLGRSLVSSLRDYGLLLTLVALMIFFQWATGGTLFKPVNLTNIILQNSYIIVMALGMLLVIVAGHIDLSVGAVSGFIGALAAMLMVGWKFPPELAFLANPLIAAAICLVVGAIVGAAQGWIIAYLGIPSFIVTLAGMLIFKGLSLAILSGKSIGPFPTEFQLLSAGFIPDWFGPTNLGFGPLHTTTLVLGVLIVLGMLFFNMRSRASRMQHGYDTEPFALFVIKNLIVAALVLFIIYMLASYKGLPNVLIVMGVLTALFVFITKQLTFGRRIYAMGGNNKAAKLSGINTERLTFFVFAIMGALAALAGMIYAARLNSATPKAGQGLELDVIAAVFIGGASMAGGAGQVAGAVVGAFIMGVMNNGMSILGVNIDWQQMIKGVVLLGAVIFDVYNKNKG
jgi:putative multiple sugar transport system permease protein